MPSSDSIDLVLLDMDGVIFEGANFWLDLHRRYGTEEDGQRLADQFLGTDYGQLAELVVGKLWKGRPATPLLELVEARDYQPGVRELMALLHSASLPSAIISSGPLALAERAQRDLGIDAIRANRVEVRNGRITGETTIAVPDSKKLEIGLELMEELGATAARTVFVGDSEADVPLASAVGLAVAYNSRSRELEAVADHVLAYGELGLLPGILGLDESIAGLGG